MEGPGLWKLDLTSFLVKKHQVLTVSADKTAKVWEISEAGSGTVSATFSFGCEVTDMQVGCLWLGEYLITVSLGGNISYLSPADPTRLLKVVSGHSKSITAITITRNGDETEIVSSSYDSVVVRWALGCGYVGKLAVGDCTSSVKKTVTSGGKIYISGLDNKVSPPSFLWLFSSHDTEKTSWKESSFGFLFRKK